MQSPILKTLLFFILSFFLMKKGFAQNPGLKASVKQNKIGIEDELEVVYSIEGDKFEIFKHDFGDFKLLKGPYESKSENMTLVAGKYVTTVSYTWTYWLKPLRTGTILISPVKVWDENKKIIQSDEIKIEVADGSLAAKQTGPLRKTLYSNYGDLKPALNDTQYPFILTAGPVFHDTSNIAALDTVAPTYMATCLASALKSITPYKDMGTYYWDNLPRQYYVLKDTTGLKDRINSCGVMAIDTWFETKIARSADWNGFIELNNLRSKNRFYTQANFYQHLEETQGIKPGMKLKLELNFSFNSAEDRTNFAGAIKKKDYIIVSSKERDDLKQYTGVTLYNIRISKPTDLKKDTLTQIAAM